MVSTSSTSVNSNSILTGISSLFSPIPQCGITSESLLSAFHLMKSLYIINSSWKEAFTQRQNLTAFPINLSEFVNTKLSAKLTRQLHDPLSLCAASFPDWCKDLAFNFPFLFNFETRYMYLYSTSFGIARGLMVHTFLSFLFFLFCFCFVFVLKDSYQNIIFI